MGCSHSLSLSLCSGWEGRTALLIFGCHLFALSWEVSSISNIYNGLRLNWKITSCGTSLFCDVRYFDAHLLKIQNSEERKLTLHVDLNAVVLEHNLVLLSLEMVGKMTIYDPVVLLPV